LATAFILVRTDIGFEHEVLDLLKAVDEVKEVHVVYGSYDLVVRVETETIGDLKETVNHMTMLGDNIRSTITMIVM